MPIANCKSNFKGTSMQRWRVCPMFSKSAGFHLGDGGGWLLPSLFIFELLENSVLPRPVTSSPSLIPENHNFAIP